MTETWTHNRLVEDLSSEVEEVRKFAVLTLARTGNPEVLPHLEKMTRDASAAVRYFARVGIDKVRRQASESRGPWDRALEETAGDDIDLLEWRRMLGDPDAERRVEAALATARVVDPAIYFIIEQHLPIETDSRVRATLIRSVSRFRRPESFELLVRFLSDPDHRVRANVVETLDELNDRRLGPLLEPLLRDPDNRTRGNALKALAQWDRKRALAGAEELAGAVEVWMRATAIWLLRELGGDDSVRVLRVMLRRETGELGDKVRAALQVLAERGNQAAVAALATGAAEMAQAAPPAAPKAEELRRLLASEAYAERMDAISQLEKLPRAEAVALLRERLGLEGHIHVLASLVRALGVVGGPEELPLLEGYLRHSDPRVRANAVDGLAAMGVPEIYGLIAPLLEDPNNRVRANAARVMAAQDSDRAFATLKEMLLSSDPLLADSALYALEKIGTDEILEILEIGLQHKNQEIQLKVLKVLEILGRSSPLARELAGKYRDRGASGQWAAISLSELLIRMNDTDASVRLAALEKLADFPDARARNRIRQATRDRDARVRDRAAALAGEGDLEERRRGLFASLGLMAFRKFKENPAAMPELSGYIERIKDASGRLDRGENVTDSLSLRRDQVQALGERVFVFFQSGKVAEPDLAELCRQLIAVEVERERRRARAVPPVTQSLWEMIPAPIWAVMVLGGFLMLSAWALMPSASGPVVWRKGSAPVCRLAVASDVLLAAEPGARLVAYRKRNGRVFWEASPGRKEVHAPAVANDLVYLAGDGGTVSAHRLATGERAFAMQVHGQIVAPPVAEADALFLLVSAPPSGTSIYLVDPRRGSVLRRDNLGPGEGQALAVTPTAELALIGERILSIERASGRKVWEYRADVPCSADPGPLYTADRTVVAAGRALVSLDLGGKLAWTQSPMESEAIVVGPLLWRNNIVVAAGSRLFVVASESGTPLASYELGAKPSIGRLAGDRFYFSTKRGAVSALSLETGRTAVVSGLGGDVRDLAADGESVFASTDKGLLALKVPDPES